MIRKQVHQNLCRSNQILCDWYYQQTEKSLIPIYSSYDIRDSGFKIANVDGNIYPAGFNNICPTDKDTSVDLFKQYLKKHYSRKISKVLILTEEHTNNPYYWDNVDTIRELLMKGGVEVLVAFPSKIEPMNMRSATGKEILVHSGYGDSPVVQTFQPDLIISNNDFSLPLEEWSQSIQIPVNPPRELGWYQRKKHRYFYHYNQLATEFCAMIDMDPFAFTVKTELFDGFDVTDDNNTQELADRVDQMISDIRLDYKKHGIEGEPFVFVKNNSGTYGLAVHRVASGAEVKEWNYKSRKKMKAAKGGREVEAVIIQEGIPSRVQSDGASAEPVIYMIGCELAGGFLRTHAEKSATDSLNSPGAVYKRLCVSDLNVSLEGNPLENVYGWSARLGMLAIAREASEMKVEFKAFLSKPCQ